MLEMTLQVEDLHLAFERIAAEATRCSVFPDSFSEEGDAVDHHHPSHIRGDGVLSNFIRDVFDRQCQGDASLMIELHCSLPELVKHLIPVVFNQVNLAPEDFGSLLDPVARPLHDIKTGMKLDLELLSENGG